MTNETKLVSLPKEVAEAMDEIKRGYGEGALRDLPQIYTLINDGPPCYKTVIDYARSEDNLYFEAVVNGYRAEKTPEELVQEFLSDNTTRKNEATDPRYYEYCRGKEVGVKEALDLLGIFIPGVNSE